MDWVYPERAWAGQLEAPVVRTLWRAGRPLSGRRVHEIAGVGAYSSVRTILHKLVLHGIVHGERAGAAVMYSMNTEHLAYPALDAALRSPDAISLLRERVDALAVQWTASDRTSPPTIALFGSVARGEASLESDVDLLVVVDDRTSLEADSLVGDLSVRVAAWTGQPAQIYLADLDLLRQAVSQDDPIVASFQDGLRYLTGVPIDWSALAA
ncbi:nucleotidyltransferase domain-containing protein [Luteimicrobium subarcticum]|uniref:Penicillinase repressor n=1 Tax=Luteimicrobium subarcticum TaxID=620910 RepID=A0A2M8WUT7_9MICO|nr:nucleotidyltransferase domain-containing protein [Luteimicrobium subarcticum]PJI94695.1 penicillinase repressor [Luteimicrobium subarcticum]